ncbi:hypothetical protein NMY22_g2927 [Coprinellus aureogranulatus]|nr:hypothetical protein NMY22_g2927 [Coprinellus aureogranulatus]
MGGKDATRLHATQQGQFSTDLSATAEGTRDDGGPDLTRGANVDEGFGETDCGWDTWVTRGSYTHNHPVAFEECIKAMLSSPEDVGERKATEQVRSKSEWGDCMTGGGGRRDDGGKGRGRKKQGRITWEALSSFLLPSSFFLLLSSPRSLPILSHTQPAIDRKSRDKGTMSSSADINNAGVVPATNSPETEALVLSDDPLHLGWVTGTGGGICIRQGYVCLFFLLPLASLLPSAFPSLFRHFVYLHNLTNNSKIVYIAPSGVQKERIKPTDIFVLSYPQPSPLTDRTFLRRPCSPLKESACTPLFYNSFLIRDAGSCIHTHSQHAVLATLLFNDSSNEWKISHQEMIKGVRRGGTGKAHSYLDTLVVPIIENTPDEEDLKEGMADAMRRYPDAAAVLVRRHGVYVWGADWEKAKTQTECLDYLFEISVKMKLAGLPTLLNAE